MTYVGALSGTELSDLYGSSAATLVTPRWEEQILPRRCGVADVCYPVVGFRRGGLTEVVTTRGGSLVDAEPMAWTGLPRL